MTLAIGVDIGGTKIAAGLVSDSGTILESVAEPTPDDATKIPAIVADLVERLSGDERPVGVGIGAAGFVGEDRATVRFAPNIDWREEPLGADVQALIDLPVVVENDANAAAWGEFRFGAGEDTEDLLLITIGTGIGGGIVHHGQLFRGGFGVAAEIGHMRVVPDGILCGCGQRGCYEQYGSGRALVRDARERVVNGDPAAAAIAALGDGGDLSRITGPAVTKLAQEGDPLSVELLTDLGRWIGEGAAALATILDPRVIAIGGGVAAAGDLILGHVVAAFETHLPARAHRPEAAVRLAALGNEAGIIGAADLARVEPA
ncbi:ROK family glucokinase [Aeromicrobium chenweiae]|uniref:Glucokinase n=1 Tax=Aeromicrobium chenweiae TaxID=2079793 RepID=A0A2S0WL55_9ACTN|nr:ROK family glucokinase [Aeromicrobium chenweiae]AWB91970.1 glucokinase [Aeromicrobium chenweiae]TGN32820.1 ROK family glucokinase [Aeromicrobium chenweiae]